MNDKLSRIEFIEGVVAGAVVIGLSPRDVLAQNDNAYLHASASAKASEIYVHGNHKPLDPQAARPISATKPGPPDYSGPLVKVVQGVKTPYKWPGTHIHLRHKARLVLGPRHERPGHDVLDAYALQILAFAFLRGIGVFAHAEPGTVNILLGHPTTEDLEVGADSDVNLAIIIAEYYFRIGDYTKGLHILEAYAEHPTDLYSADQYRNSVLEFTKETSSPVASLRALNVRTNGDETNRISFNEDEIVSGSAAMSLITTPGHSSMDIWDARSPDAKVTLTLPPSNQSFLNVDINYANRLVSVDGITKLQLPEIDSTLSDNRTVEQIF